MNTEHTKSFIKVVESEFYRHSKWQVFSDFVLMAAASLHNALNPDDELEQLYLDCAKRYSAEELKAMTALLAITVNALEDGPHDFLGPLFMEMGLSNDKNGQFFTPYCVCQMMAKMTMPADEFQDIETGDYRMVSDPACGAGALMIAGADHLRSEGVNIQRSVFFVGVDVDATAAYMAYIQLALLDIPGQIIIGNTLSLETRRTMATPAAYLYNWNWRLQQRHESQPPKMITVAPEAVHQPITDQMELFA